MGCIPIEPAQVFDCAVIRGASGVATPRRHGLRRRGVARTRTNEGSRGTPRHDSFW